MLGYTSELISAQVNGNAISNSTIAQSLLPAQGQFILPANFLSFIGQELLIEASGRISTLAATPGTIQFAVKFQNFIVAVSGQLALNVNAKTDVTWWLRWALTARAIAGSTSNVMHTGFWTSEAVIGSPVPTAGGSGLLLIPASAPAVGANFNNVASLTVDLTAQWSVASPSNSIQLHQYRLLSPN